MEYRLPIEDHEIEICEHVSKHRVTIIHGETGCGKSSTVPIMLMQSHDKAWEKATQNKHAEEEDREGVLPIEGYARMFITQPRRIAARSLCERVKSSIIKLNTSKNIDSSLTYSPELVGLRLGHGEKSQDTSKTRIWFATTGYVVLLLAHHPEFFKDHTHLILDEVHERSIDTDVLCFLARKLIHTHPTIKLVLMSATLAAALYQQYFGIPEPPLFVGAKRFEVKELFAEDLATMNFKGNKKQFDKLALSTCKGKELKREIGTLQISGAIDVVTKVGVPGTSILIFVAGMADIVDICSKFEILDPRERRYKLIPIHSELPDEEQAEAFVSAPDMVKVLVATNVAESSITIPDCDHVICFGVHKQIEYNAAKHRTMLSPLWISRASAVQRAGRTGRVRPGTVYRLYSKEMFRKYMSEFDHGEMGRQPLDRVILSLRQMLNEKVVPILEDVLEPPPLKHIDRAFTSLHSDGLITEANDDGELTDLGSFISQLGLDINMGRLIGLGSVFGVLPEAIAMANMLSAPKSPFRIATELTMKDPRDYSEAVNAIMHARHRLDCGVLSEPIMLINLLYLYRTTKNRDEFCRVYGLSHLRMRQINNAYTHLLTRITDILFKPDRKFSKNNNNNKQQNHEKKHYQKMEYKFMKEFEGTAASLDIVNSKKFNQFQINTTKSTASPQKVNPSIIPSQVMNKQTSLIQNMNQDIINLNHKHEENEDSNNKEDEDEINKTNTSSTSKLSLNEKMKLIERDYFVQLGPAKLGVLRMLLVWVFSDQVITQKPMSAKLNITNTPIDFEELSTNSKNNQSKSSGSNSSGGGGGKKNKKNKKKGNKTNELTSQNESKSLVISLLSDTKIIEYDDILAVLNPPQKLNVDFQKDIPIWKSCRYYVYYNEGRSVKEATSRAKFDNYSMKEQFALDFNLQLLILRNDDMIYVWLSSAIRYIPNILPSILFNHVQQLIIENDFGSSFIIKSNKKTLHSEIKHIFEDLTFDNVVIGSLTDKGNKIEILSRGQQLYEEELDMLFNTGPQTLLPNHNEVIDVSSKKKGGGIEYYHRLTFYERIEVSKSYKLYCPIQNNNTTTTATFQNKKQANNEEDSLRLMNNLPLSAMILGQTSRKSKFKVFDQTKVENQITEVSHDVPFPRWTSFARNETMMMDAHTLEAASMHFDSLMARPDNKKIFKKETLYAVATNMLDLKSGGSRCMGVCVLPPGPHFLALSFATFGMSLPSHLLSQCTAIRSSLEDAILFNKMCDRLGESMFYQPELTKWLLNIFQFISYPDDDEFEDEDGISESKAKEMQAVDDMVMANFGHGSVYNETAIVTPSLDDFLCGGNIDIGNDDGCMDDEQYVKSLSNGTKRIEPVTTKPSYEGKSSSELPIMSTEGMNDFEYLTQLWHQSHVPVTPLPINETTTTSSLSSTISNQDTQNTQNTSNQATVSINDKKVNEEDEEIIYQNVPLPKSQKENQSISKNDNKKKDKKEVSKNNINIDEKKKKASKQQKDNKKILDSFIYDITVNNNIDMVEQAAEFMIKNMGDIDGIDPDDYFFNEFSSEEDEYDDDDDDDDDGTNEGMEKEVNRHHMLSTRCLSHLHSWSHYVLLLCAGAHRIKPYSTIQQQQQTDQNIKEVNHNEHEHDDDDDDDDDIDYGKGFKSVHKNVAGSIECIALLSLNTLQSLLLKSTYTINTNPNSNNSNSIKWKNLSNKKTEIQNIILNLAPLLCENVSGIGSTTKLRRCSAMLLRNAKISETIFNLRNDIIKSKQLAYDAEMKLNIILQQQKHEYGNGSSSASSDSNQGGGLSAEAYATGFPF